MLNIISLGAGVQSSTMALMAAHGEITPMPDCAIFADTQAGPRKVYEWLDWLEKQLPFPVHRVSAGSLADGATIIKTSKGGNKYTSTGIPAFISNGLSVRQCTEDYKIIPIGKEIRRLRDKQPVTQWIGISVDESHRMKPSRNKYCTNRWPLVEMDISRNQCIEWMQRNNYPAPPRSACIFCPFKSDLEWRLLRNEQPEEFEEAAKFEERLQQSFSQTRMRGIPFLHRSKVPLRTVDLRTAEDAGQMSMFGNECEGMCGV